MADNSEIVGQNEIEALLNQAQGPAAAPPASQASPAKGSTNPGTLPRGKIDSLLNGASGGIPRGGGTAVTTQGSTSARSAGGSSSSYGATGASTSSCGDDIQLLLEQAEQAIASVTDPNPSPANIQAFQFRDLVGSAPSNEKATIDLLRDVELDLKIELGRTHMALEELLKLRRGSVVPLDKLAGDPVDVYVNGRLIARGEVLVLNDNFCVRVAELISGDD